MSVMEPAAAAVVAPFVAKLLKNLPMPLRLALVIGLLVVLGVLGVGATYLFRSQPPPAPPPVVVQAAKLSQLVKEATDSMTRLQAEMEAKAALAKELNQRAEQAQALATTNEAEAAAVVARFDELLAAHGRDSFWSAVFLNSAFFVAGVLVTVFVARVQNSARNKSGAAPAG